MTNQTIVKTEKTKYEHVNGNGLSKFSINIWFIFLVLKLYGSFDFTRFFQNAKDLCAKQVKYTRENNF